MEWKTKVTELLGIKYPIIQGGLHICLCGSLRGGIEAGGLGQITAMSLESPDALTG